MGAPHFLLYLPTSLVGRNRRNEGKERKLGFPGGGWVFSGIGAYICNNFKTALIPSYHHHLDWNCCTLLLGTLRKCRRQLLINVCWYTVSGRGRCCMLSQGANAYKWVQCKCSKAKQGDFHVRSLRTGDAVTLKVMPVQEKQMEHKDNQVLSQRNARAGL